MVNEHGLAPPPYSIAALVPSSELLLCTQIRVEHGLKLTQGLSCKRLLGHGSKNNKTMPISYIEMVTKMISISAVLIIFSTLFFPLPDFKRALASLELGSIDEITKNFTENLNTEVERLVSEAINNSKNAINASTIALSNGSNISSSQIIVSNNQNVSASAGQGSLILNQIKNENGECRATQIGGSGDDSLSSVGVCNDQFTGGLGADKFICGQGNDTIRDFSPDEGDVIVDRQSCETVL